MTDLRYVNCERWFFFIILNCCCCSLFYSVGVSMLRFGCAMPLLVLIFLVCTISDSHTLLMLFDAPFFSLSHSLSLGLFCCHHSRSLSIFVLLFLAQFSTQYFIIEASGSVWHQATTFSYMLRLHQNRLGIVVVWNHLDWMDLLFQSISLSKSNDRNEGKKSKKEKNRTNFRKSNRKFILQKYFPCSLYTWIQFIVTPIKLLNYMYLALTILILFYFFSVSYFTVSLVLSSLLSLLRTCATRSCRAKKKK